MERNSVWKDRIQFAGWCSFDLGRLRSQTPPIEKQKSPATRREGFWVSRYFQAGVEAIIPMDAHSGRDLGERAEAHLYLPAIFPDFYAKPLFGN